MHFFFILPIRGVTLSICFVPIICLHFRELGVYWKTFWQVIKIDIRKFMAIYSVVMLAFSGGIYLAATASNQDLRYVVSVNVV